VPDADGNDLPQTDDGDSEESAASRKEERRPRRRLWPRGWRGAAFAGLLLLAILAFGGWLGIEATHAKSSLEEARGNAQKAKEAFSNGHTDDAAKWSAEAMSNAQSARDATHSLPWNIASVVPWVGSPFKTGQQVSDVVSGLAADVLRPSVNVGEALTPDRLLADGRLDVQMLRKAAPQLSEISTAATRLGEQASAISEPGYLSVMRDARTALQAQTSELSDLLDHAALAAQLAPSMMGADGPRSYFMGFQTNAEARGTGGLLGAFGILRFDNGKPSVDTLGRNSELTGPSARIDLGTEFTARYGNAPTTDFRASNLSPHFPYAAQIWKSMWEQQSGTTVDGVVAIDPVALSYILGAVGPLTMPDGETITKDNVVELTESTAYIRFPVDQNARKAYLLDIAAAVVRKMTEPVPSPRELLDALGRAITEGRVAVWSSSPADQQLLEKTPLAHVVPDDPAPYAQVVINNLSGNKMDYYLTRHIEYSAGACDSETRNSTVTVRLTNTVRDEQSLPEYVIGQEGLIGIVDINRLPKASDVTSVTLFATKNATLRGLLVNGARGVPYFKGTQRGHPTFELQLFVEPQKTVEVKFELTEPTSPGAARVPIQPLRDSVVPVVSVPECSGSPAKPPA
jgi:hypothetical protein